MTTLPSPTRRTLIAGTAAAALGVATLNVRAQTTAVRFQLDWRFEGPSALFLSPAARGHFRSERLDVTIDSGNGSAGAVTRVASGTYDLGFADLAALMEFHANNPTAPNKPVAVMMVYSNTPAAVLALRRSGIRTPADLSGKRLGAPVFDAGRRAFSLFARANNVGNVTWTSMDPPLRETMLVRGDVDAITGFSFTSLLNLEARGVPAADVVVFPYAQHGVRLYGNAIIVSEPFLRAQPEAVRGFLRAFTRGVREVIADPRAAIAHVRARDGIVNEELEHRRLRMALDAVVLTADARSEGFGAVHPPRLALMASQVADAFATRERINPDAVWNGGFLPPAAERNIFAAVRS